MEQPVAAVVAELPPAKHPDRGRAASSSRLRVVAGSLTLGLLAALLALGGGGVDSAIVDLAGAETIDWVRVDPPEAALRAESLVAGGGGFALLARPPAPAGVLWFSADGLDWTPSELDELPFGLVPAGDDLVAFREYRSVRLNREGTRWNEQTVTALPTYTRIGYLSGRAAVVVADDGLLVHSVEGELWFAAEGEDFELVVPRGEWWDPSEDIWERFTSPARPRGCRPPLEGSLDYPPVISTPEGTVAFVPLIKSGINITWPVCDPQLWVSGNGVAWSVSAEVTGFEPLSFVYDVAGGPGGYVAVGGRGEGRPTLWRSGDAVQWTALDWPEPTDGFTLTNVFGGEAGFVIIGRSAVGQLSSAWFSPDGRCWIRVPEHIRAGRAAVGRDRIVIAEQRLLPEPGIDLWVGVLDLEAGVRCDRRG